MRNKIALKILLTFFFSIISFSSFSQTEYNFSEGCKKLNEKIFSLQLSLAREEVAVLKKKEPNNLLPIFLENYIYFFKHFNIDDEKSFNDESSEFDKCINALKKGDKKSPWYKYCLAEVLLHQSILKAKYGKFTGAGLNAREAYQLLKSNYSAHPLFVANKKSLGALEIVAGSIPPSYQWAASLVGFKGDVDAGVLKIQECLLASNKDEYLKSIQPVIVFMYAYMYQGVMKSPLESWKTVDNYTKNASENLLSCYTRAYVASKCKKNDELINTVYRRPMNMSFQFIPYLYYLSGNAQVYKLDKKAFDDFEIYLKFSKSNNYKLAIMYKKAMLYAAENNKVKCDEFLKEIKNSNANLKIEDDKQAKREASEFIYNPALIKGRLYFDGGYFEKALAELKNIKYISLTEEKEKLEYHYRFARVYQELTDDENAILQFKEVIEKGKKAKWYYAANACVQLGSIYELNKNTIEAKKYYKMVFEMKNEEYKAGLELKAKAGLNRLK